MNKDKQLPEGWRMVKFGDMAKHISKRVEPSETDLNIYVGLEHLDPDSLRIKRHGVPSDVEGQKLLVKKGQIIFGKRRAYQRKLGVAEWDCICSAHAMVLEANPETVLPEFLPFFMQSDEFMSRAVSISEGSLSPTIKWKVLEQQTFYLPNIENQKKLLTLILKVEENLNAAEKTLCSGVRVKRLFSDSLLNCQSRLAGFTNEWKTVKLKEIGKLISGLTYSPSDVTQNNNALLVLRSSNIQDGLLSFEDNVFVNIDVNKEQLSRENDILICVRNGSKNLIGKSALITKECPKATNGAFMSVFRSDDYRYVFHLFQSTAYRKQVLKNLGATINSINGKDLENFKFKIPEKNEREAISEFLEKLDNTISRLVISRNEIFQLKKSLLSKITMQPV